MAITIISESYGPRKPLIECTADSLDELAALECAEGSTATVGGTEYILDRVNGWIVPGSGGGDGAFIIDCTVSYEGEDEEGVYAIDKTLEEINAAYNAGQALLLKLTEVYDGVRSDESNWYYLEYAQGSYYQFQGSVDVETLSCRDISIYDDDGLYIEPSYVSASRLPVVMDVFGGSVNDWSSGLTLTWDYDEDEAGMSLVQYLQYLVENGRGVTVRARLTPNPSNPSIYFDFPLISASLNGFVFGACEPQIIEDVPVLFFNGVTLNPDGTSSSDRYQITGT